MSDVLQPSRGRPIHVAIIPVTNGLQVPTAKKVKLCVAQTPLLDNVLAAYRTADTVTECPKRSHMKCGRIASKNAVLVDEEVFLYEVPLGEMTRTTTMASFLTMIDVALIYWPAAVEHISNADETILQHLTTHLLPLLVGMKLRGIFGFVPNDATGQLWASATAAMQQSAWCTSTCDMNGCDPYASDLELTAAFKARIDLVRRVQTTPTAWEPKEGLNDASRPLRMAVVRRFDKIAVMVCHVLQGTVRVGDALVAVEDPMRTSSNNTIVSLRSFPDNMVVSSATAGMQVGLVVESQLPFAQGNTKAALDAAPFLSLHLGAVLVRAGEFPVTLPCLIKATTTRSHQEGQDVTLLGTGGITIARVVGASSRSHCVALSTVPSVDHGFFVDDVPSRPETDAAVSLRPYQKTFEHRQACVIGLTHSDKGIEFFPLEILAVKHRLRLHRHLLKTLTGPTLPTTDTDIAAAVESWTPLMQQPAVGSSGCTAESAQRYSAMLVDEITCMLPSSLVAILAMKEGDGDGAASGWLHEVVNVPEMDLLMLVSRIPVPRLAVRLWQRLVAFVIEHAGVHQDTQKWAMRKYLPERSVAGGGSSRVLDEDQTMDLMVATLARSARNRFWLQQVASAAVQLTEARALSATKPAMPKRVPLDLFSVVQRRWMRFGIQEGSGLIKDAFGCSPRRAASVAHHPTAVVKTATDQERIAFLGDVLEAPNGVTSATLYAAMQVLDNAPATSTHAERYQKERIAHRPLNIGSMLKKVVSPAIKRHFARWLLAAGLSTASPADAILMGRCTFIELEAMYVMQWALQRKGIALHSGVLQRILHYLLLMSPTK